MLKEHRPLLSICIPTFNRANIIEETLNRFINNREFDNDVEIVISDNASTDHTEEICTRFTHICSNIKYFKNSSNIKDSNFIKVLNYGKGHYLKLLNDWSYYNEDDLRYVKSTIKEYLESKKAIFFSSNYIYTRKKREKIICNSLDEYIQAISTFVTCNNVFGAWNEEWQRVVDKEKYSSLQLQQVDWSFQIVKKNNGCILFDKETLKTASVPVGIRGGYNWFQVHLDNYYKIMIPYINDGLISLNTFKQDSHYLLEHFKRELCNIYFIKLDKRWQFDTKGTLKLLLKYYKKDIYFYYFLLKMPLWYFMEVCKTILCIIKRIIRKVLLKCITIIS